MNHDRSIYLSIAGLCLCLTGWRGASQSGVHQGQGFVPPEGAGEGGWKPSGEVTTTSTALSHLLSRPATWLNIRKPGTSVALLGCDVKSWWLIKSMFLWNTLTLTPGHLMISEILLHKSQLDRLEVKHGRSDGDGDPEECFCFFHCHVAQLFPVLNTDEIN